MRRTISPTSWPESQEGSFKTNCQPFIFLFRNSLARELVEQDYWLHLEPLQDGSVDWNDQSGHGR
ncbi:MAG: hypothetical protein DWQ01_09150 [Planctomycetota bacterium]|nr:MAG: hypothetical protein DWQ01_09150 [Planctomycetota bacterium]